MNNFPTFLRLSHSSPAVTRVASLVKIQMFKLSLTNWIKMSVLADTVKDAAVSDQIQTSKELSSTSTPTWPVETTGATSSLPPFFWMVKPCLTYKEEFSDCKSFKARFNQYFIEGESKDCSQWGVDYTNCKKWKDENDRLALNLVIESEKQRSRMRLKAHFDNDVWEHREKPPDDWDKELPESIRQEYKGSFLQYKADEIKQANIDLVKLNRESDDISRGSWCSIV